MMRWLVLSMLLIAVNAFTTPPAPVTPTQTMEFPQEASEVAGLAEIRRYGLTDVLVPEARRLRQQYLDAVAAAENSVGCATPVNPEYEACASCVSQRCLGRAAHICSTNRYFDAKAIIEKFLATILPTVVFPEGPNLSADEALAAFDAFLAGNELRLKRAAAVSEPYCPELRTNDTACAFYLVECECAPVCVTTLRALEAKKRFEFAVPGFLSGYQVQMFMLDLNTFDEAEGGFMKTKARVEIAGQTLEFFVDRPALPYAAADMGPIVARQALDEYYRQNPSRNSDLSQVSG